MKSPRHCEPLACSRRFTSAADTLGLLASLHIPACICAILRHMSSSCLSASLLKLQSAKLLRISSIARAIDVIGNNGSLTWLVFEVLQRLPILFISRAVRLRDGSFCSDSKVREMQQFKKTTLPSSRLLNAFRSTGFHMCFFSDSAGNIYIYISIYSYMYKHIHFLYLYR